MNRIVVFFMMIIAFSKLNAPIYGGEVCYYIEAGEELNSSTYVRVFKFAGEKIVDTGGPKNEVTNKMRQSKTYWEDELERMLDKNQRASYESSLSTSYREVYSTDWKGVFTYIPTGGLSGYWGCPKIGTIYYAFALDKKSIILWREDNNGEIKGEKIHYVRINKNELEPKATNRYFLYE